MYNEIEDIIAFFFQKIKERGKYEVLINNNQATIIPRLEEQYYKPNILVKDLKSLEKTLYEYLKTVAIFYKNTEFLDSKHNSSYFLSTLLFNLTNSDAIDLEKYIKQRISFLKDTHFNDLTQPTIIEYTENYDITAQKELSYLGFESPYIIRFSITINDITYPLPLVRYAIDENNVCHLFAIQYDRKTSYTTSDDYKKVINKINSGIKKYRNIQPSFLVVLKHFTELLTKEGIDTIISPDYLFSRYRKYYKANSEKKSDLVLERILDNYLILLQRMEYQFPFFEINEYPNEIDSYTHIKIKL